jgi:putative selenium metabolism protein SsnA
MLILQNASILQYNPPKYDKNLDIVIDDDIIKEVGKSLAEEYKNDRDVRIIDLNNKIVVPGHVCAHTHCYSTLSRGMMVDLGKNPDFITILKDLWWKLDRVITREILCYSATISAIETIVAGTTSLIDHHASPNYIKNSLHAIAEAFSSVGIRGVLAYEITCRNNGLEEAEEGLNETVDFINQLNNKRFNLLSAAIGGHASFTLSDEVLNLMGKMLYELDTGFHVHVAEDAYDASYTHHHYGLNILRRFEKFGLINNKAILAHGVHLTDEDTDIINNYGAFLIHNARSNMNNAVGYNKNIDNVENIALGTDGIGFNMYDESKFAYFKSMEERSLIGSNILKHLYSGNIILERYFGKQFGKIEKNYTADLLIIDYMPPTPITDENLLGHFIFGMSAVNVDSVIINGQLVLENKRLDKNLYDIYKNAQKEAKLLWNKVKEIC